MPAPTFYLTTPIFYPNGAPHIGHAYTALASDAITRFERLDGKDVFFLTGTDEHGLKMQQTAEREALTPQALADKNSAVFPAIDGRPRRRTGRLHPHHRGAASPRVGGNLAPHGIRRRHLPSTRTLAGTRSVRKPSSTRRETTVGDDGVRREPLGSPVRVGRGGELLLSPFVLPGSPAGALRSQPRFHRTGRTPQRSRELRQRRPQGSVDLAHHFQLGHQGSRRAEACDVRLGRRADQLHHRRWLPERRGAALALLAGRRSRHRQGHRPFPRRLLAGVPVVGEDRGRRSASMPTASCSIAGRRCRSRSATSSTRSR